MPYAKALSGHKAPAPAPPPPGGAFAPPGAAPEGSHYAAMMSSKASAPPPPAATPAPYASDLGGKGWAKAPPAPGKGAPFKGQF